MGAGLRDGDKNVRRAALEVMGKIALHFILICRLWYEQIRQGVTQQAIREWSALIIIAYISQISMQIVRKEDRWICCGFLEKTPFSFELSSINQPQYLRTLVSEILKHWKSHGVVLSGETLQQGGVPNFLPDYAELLEQQGAIIGTLPASNASRSLLFCPIAPSSVVPVPVSGDVKPDKNDRSDAFDTYLKYSSDMRIFANSKSCLINISDHGNNCGLFALTLGVKRALDRDSAKASSLQADFVIFIRQCEEKDFTGITQKTDGVGQRLRGYIFEALRQDETFKAGRYQNFVPMVVNYATEGLKSLPQDMEALQNANQALLDSVKNEWRALSQYLERFYEDFSHNTDISEEQVIAFLVHIRSIISDNTQNHAEAAKRLFEEYKAEHNDLFFLTALYQRAWARVKQKDASPEIRQLFNESMAKCFRREMVERLIAIPEAERKVREACRFGFLEGVKFGEQVIEPSLEIMRENARSLLIESLVMAAWSEIYQRYLEYVRDEPVYLSADELGCLAKYWNVQLEINFQDEVRPPYRSYSQADPTLLSVVLCNPSQGHWMVDETLVGDQLLNRMHEVQEPETTTVLFDVLTIPPTTILPDFDRRKRMPSESVEPGDIRVPEDIKTQVFTYDTYQEATRKKAQISKTLLGVDARVVSVSTEEEEIYGRTMYSVKIGLTIEASPQVVDSVLEQLEAVAVVDLSKEKAARAQAISNALSHFRQEGQIVAEMLEIQRPTPILLFTACIRPVHPGVSVGHSQAKTAGTIGAILTEFTTSNDGVHYMLSNNHVLANTNKASRGDAIVQPGIFDTPIVNGEERTVAQLEYFHPISDDDDNDVDVAIAKLVDQSNLNCIIPDIGEVSSVGDATIRMIVEKTGRSTNHTLGTIVATDADIVIDLDCDGSRKARFVNQIKTSKMSKPGDSGALLITKDSEAASCKAVGLLFASSPINSYANHYSKVHKALQVGGGYTTNFAKP